MPLLDIVYPVGPGDKNDDLRYSLRAVEKFASGAYRQIVIVGHAPSWIKGVEVIKVPQNRDKWLNARTNIETACRCEKITNDFVLFNDDFILTEPVINWQNITNCYLGTLREQEAKYANLENAGEWKRGFEFNRRLLQQLGIMEPLNFEVHGPIIFNREKRLYLFEREEFRKYHQRSDKLLFQRSIYKNLYLDNGPKLIRDPKLLGDRKDIQKYACGFFSVTDNLIGNKEAAPNLNRWLDEHLSFKSSFEK